MLSPSDWHRYLRDSRIVERVRSRLKVRRPEQNVKIFFFFFFFFFFLKKKKKKKISSFSSSFFFLLTALQTTPHEAAIYVIYSLGLISSVFFCVAACHPLTALAG